MKCTNYNYISDVNDTFRSYFVSVASVRQIQPQQKKTLQLKTDSYHKNKVVQQQHQQQSRIKYNNKTQVIHTLFHQDLFWIESGRPWCSTKSQRAVSCCLLVCNEEGRSGLLSSLVCICTEWHRLCTAPSLVWCGGIFQHSFVIHQYHPVDGEAESLSLSVSEVSSLLRTGGSQLLFQPQA